MPHTYKNEVHLAGELAKDPVTRYTATSKTVTNLTILTKYQEKPEYHRVTAWENLAEKVGALHKGEFVKIVGRLQTRSWEDAAKVKHYSTEIVAFQVAIPDEEPAKATAIPTGGRAVAEAILSPSKPKAESDDIPF
jgi:single-strand DNA-binding protein